ncbi:hypothetical protein OUZ56_033177 [Daphnia magna]|uniref:Uncharacterized protein n=1 Tax=Daphnia magna TaxID=35525 RepID=A0ABR0BAE3_9CRUS|nr:hypothetical protein OUZ56_033177 [Daphnia magna]
MSDSSSKVPKVSRVIGTALYFCRDSHLGISPRGGIGEGHFRFASHSESGAASCLPIGAHSKSCRLFVSDRGAWGPFVSFRGASRFAAFRSGEAPSSFVAFRRQLLFSLFRFALSSVATLSFQKFPVVSAAFAASSDPFGKLREHKEASFQPLALSCASPSGGVLLDPDGAARKENKRSPSKVALEEPEDLRPAVFTLGGCVPEAKKAQRTSLCDRVGAIGEEGVARVLVEVDFGVTPTSPRFFLQFRRCGREDSVATAVAADDRPNSTHRRWGRDQAVVGRHRSPPATGKQREAAAKAEPDEGDVLLLKPVLPHQPRPRAARLVNRDPLPGLHRGEGVLKTPRFPSMEEVWGYRRIPGRREPPYDTVDLRLTPKDLVDDHDASARCFGNCCERGSFRGAAVLREEARKRCAALDQRIKCALGTRRQAKLLRPSDRRIEDACLARKLATPTQNLRFCLINAKRSRAVHARECLVDRHERLVGPPECIESASQAGGRIEVRGEVLATLLQHRQCALRNPSSEVGKEPMGIEDGPLAGRPRLRRPTFEKCAPCTRMAETLRPVGPLGERFVGRRQSELRLLGRKRRALPAQESAVARRINIPQRSWLSSPVPDRTAAFTQPGKSPASCSFVCAATRGSPPLPPPTSESTSSASKPPTQTSRGGELRAVSSLAGASNRKNVGNAGAGCLAKNSAFSGMSASRASQTASFAWATTRGSFRTKERIATQVWHHVAQTSTNTGFLARAASATARGASLTIQGSSVAACPATTVAAGALAPDAAGKREKAGEGARGGT